MELVCHNKKHALFSSETATFLYELPRFTLKGTLESRTKIGALQYGTGIAAIVSQSKVRIYGKEYDRQTSCWDGRCTTSSRT